MNHDEEKTLGSLYYQVGKNNSELTAEEIRQSAHTWEEIDTRSLDLWFEGFIRKEKRKKKNEQQIYLLKRILKFAAIILLVFALGVSTLTITSEAFRTKFFNMVIEMQEEFTDITFSEQTENLLEGWSNYYIPEYIPEGYDLKEANEHGSLQSMLYRNGAEQEIMFLVAPLTGSASVDTEEAVVTNIEIQGMKGLLIEKEDRVIIVWSNNDSMFQLIGLNKQEMIQIAESIKKVNNKE